VQPSMARRVIVIDRLPASSKSQHAWRATLR
jgi:hypothetical protein